MSAEKGSLLYRVLNPTKEDDQRDTVYEIMKRLQTGKDPKFLSNSFRWGILDSQHSAAFEEICRAFNLP